MAKYKLSSEEYLRLKAEFEKLNAKQKEIADAHRDAIAEGDDRECEAWSLSNMMSREIFERLSFIDDILRNCEVIKNSKGNKSAIDIGKRVKIIFGGKEQEWQLCDPVEANPLENKLSVNSELGKILINKKIGDVFEIMTLDSKSITVKILDIL